MQEEKAYRYSFSSLYSDLEYSEYNIKEYEKIVCEILDYYVLDNEELTSMFYLPLNNKQELILKKQWNKQLDNLPSKSVKQNFFMKLKNKFKKTNF